VGPTETFVNFFAEKHEVRFEQCIFANTAQLMPSTDLHGCVGSNVGSKLHYPANPNPVTFVGMVTFRALLKPLVTLNKNDSHSFDREWDVERSRL
jgi:hypothetical protein